MNGIGWAVKELQDGQRVRREGWNRKETFLFLVPGSRFVDYHAHVDMKTAQGYIIPWLCSQSDLLATDWETA